MIGGTVPHDDQLVLGPFGPEPAQNIDGVLAVGAGIGPQPHLAFVVEIEAVERELVRKTRRGRGNPEMPAPGGVGFSPRRPSRGRSCWAPANRSWICSTKACRRCGSARPSSFLAFFHDNPRRCRAARIVSRQQVRPNRSPTQPTRRRSVQRGGGSAPATGGGGGGGWAARIVSPRPASISGQRGGAA